MYEERTKDVLLRLADVVAADWDREVAGGAGCCGGERIASAKDLSGEVLALGRRRERAANSEVRSLSDRLRLFVDESLVRESDCAECFHAGADVRGNYEKARAIQEEAKRINEETASGG